MEPILTFSAIQKPGWIFENNQKNRTFTANWYLRYQLAEGLSFRTEFGLNTVAVNQSQYMDARLQSNGLAQAQSSSSTRNSWNWKNLLNYRKNFGNHNIDFFGWN